MTSLIFYICVCIFLFITVGCFFAIIWCVFGLFKNSNTAKNHFIIIDAIHDYNTHLLKNDPDNFDELKVEYCEMESYDETYHRILDWGYTRILPSDKFELVKPFIKNNKKENKNNAK